MDYQRMQRLMLPQSSNSRIEALYFRRSSGVIHDRKKELLEVPEGEVVEFSTYFNGFFLNQWTTYTNYKSFRIKVRFTGAISWNICIEYQNQEGELLPAIPEMTGDWGVIEIPSEWITRNPSICYLAAQGQNGGGRILDVWLEGILEHPNEVIPAIVICTYKRELFVRTNLRQLAQLEETEVPDVFLVDNGGTLETEQFPDFVKYIKNKNTGGTGGFTRGILEVLDSLKNKPYTHVILMDDDITFDTGILDKTIQVLRGLKKLYSQGELAGSLLQKSQPWLQYECGARWNTGKIQALHHALDMREMDAILENSRKCQGEYGGWWYCCIPISSIQKRGLPLPFFVHRDDIEYGMRMGRVTTMNGIGVWHDAFEEKLPQTGEYYDVRNMAILNSIYAYPQEWGKEKWKWFLRKWVAGNILRGRYHYVNQNLMGVRDFLKGADWFCKENGAELHQKVGSYMKPLESFENLPEKTRKRAYMAGPGVSVYLAAVKKRIVYRDNAGGCMSAEKSMAKAVQCLYHLYKMERQIDRYFDRAACSYQRKFEELTGTKFWKKYLEMKEDES